MREDGLLDPAETWSEWPALVEGEFRRPPAEHVLDHLVRLEVLTGDEPFELYGEIQSRPSAGTVALVLGNALPGCDLCRIKGRGKVVARYDGPVSRDGRGAWGFMCADCYLVHSTLRLGTGRGQYLMTRDEVDTAVREAFARAKEYWRARGVNVPEHDPFEE
jgi:hypothetical protein